MQYIELYEDVNNKYIDILLFESQYFKLKSARIVQMVEESNSNLNILNEGFISTFIGKVYHFCSSIFGFIGKIIKKIIDWIIGLFSSSDSSSSGGGGGSGSSGGSSSSSDIKSKELEKEKEKIDKDLNKAKEKDKENKEKEKKIESEQNDINKELEKNKKTDDDINKRVEEINKDNDEKLEKIRKAEKDAEELRAKIAAQKAKEEAERIKSQKAKEEAEILEREKAAAEEKARKAKEEAERLEREKAAAEEKARKAKEEAEEKARKAKEEAERLEREKAEAEEKARKAKEETERLERKKAAIEEAARKAREEAKEKEKENEKNVNLILQGSLDRIDTYNKIIKNLRNIFDMIKDYYSKNNHRDIKLLIDDVYNTKKREEELPVNRFPLSTYKNTKYYQRIKDSIDKVESVRNNMFNEITTIISFYESIKNEIDKKVITSNTDVDKLNEILNKAISIYNEGLNYNNDFMLYKEELSNISNDRNKVNLYIDKLSKIYSEYLSKFLSLEREKEIAKNIKNKNKNNVEILELYKKIYDVHFKVHQIIANIQRQGIDDIQKMKNKGGLLDKNNIPFIKYDLNTLLATGDDVSVVLSVFDYYFTDISNIVDDWDETTPFLFFLENNELKNNPEFIVNNYIDFYRDEFHYNCIKNIIRFDRNLFINEVILPEAFKKSNPQTDINSLKPINLTLSEIINYYNENNISTPDQIKQYLRELENKFMKTENNSSKEIKSIEKLIKKYKIDQDSSVGILETYTFFLTAYQKQAEAMLYVLRSFVYRYIIQRNNIIKSFNLKEVNDKLYEN